MKIAIISDLHANLEAVSALPRDHDELWVLGDLVNYGPNPAEVIEFVRSEASVVIRGNHDHAIGYCEDPRCAPAFKAMADATRRYTDEVLSDEQKQFLRDLPITATRYVDHHRVYLCHAMPTDPLFGYCPPDSPRWRDEVFGVPADVLLVGHTHLPFVLEIDGRRVANPGSVGQPKSGGVTARYAVWEDGRLGLRSYAYEVAKTVEKLHGMPIPEQIQRDLADVLQTGSVRNA